MSAAIPRSAPRRGWFDLLIDSLALLSGVLLSLLTALICVDVIARKLGFFTIPWTLDVAEYTLYVVTFFGSPWVLREGGHISIDLFVTRFGPVGQRRLALASHVIGATACAVLLYYSGRVWWVSYSEQIKVYETFVFPEWILMSVAPPTFLILLAVFVRFIARPDGGAAADQRSDGL